MGLSRNALFPPEEFPMLETQVLGQSQTIDFDARTPVAEPEQARLGHFIQQLEKTAPGN